MTAGKRRGRPPLDPDDPSVALHVRLPAKQFDATYQQAQAARQTMADWVRHVLRDAAARHSVSKSRP